MELQSYGSEPDPFDSPDPGTLLAELQTFKGGSAALSSLGLLHLFTGRDLVESSSPSAQLLGAATLGTLCDPTRAVGVTQARGNAMDALIAAHEIAHNFGAPHDAEPGSVCAAAPAGKLMDPTYSASTEFSQCSIDQIQIKLAAAACKIPLLPANVTLWLLSSAPPPVIKPDVSYEFKIAVENTSGADAVGVKLLIDAPGMRISLRDQLGPAPGSCDVLLFAHVSCLWLKLPNGARYEGTISFLAKTPGETAAIDVHLSSVTETDTAGDSLHFDIDVLPYVDLAVAATPQAVSLRPDEQSSVSVAISNIGMATAHDVIAHVKGDSTLEVDTADIGLGQCVSDGDSYHPGYDCPVGTLAPGESRNFGINFSPRANLSPEEMRSGGNLGVGTSSLEPDRSSGDNSYFIRATIGNSIADLVIEQSSPQSAYLDERIVVGVNVRNDGPDAVRDLVLRGDWSGPGNPHVVEMTAIGAACQLPAAPNAPMCEIPELAPGQKFGLTLFIAMSSPGPLVFNSLGTTSSSDPRSDNNGGLSVVTVVERPPPPPSPIPPATPPSPPSDSGGGGGGGGGGALDLLTLSALGLLEMVALCRAWQLARRHAVRSRVR